MFRIEPFHAEVTDLVPAYISMMPQSGDKPAFPESRRPDDDVLNLV